MSTLAYYNVELIMSVKSFIVQAPDVSWHTLLPPTVLMFRMEDLIW